MFSFPNPKLEDGTASNLLKPFDIHTFHEAVVWVWKLPYGRTSDRSNYLLVPLEKKGACSGKHSFLAQMAIEQKIPLHLTVGIFMMDQDNTPEIGSILENHGIRAIPEAHCYLSFQNEQYDFTKYEESVQPTPNLRFVYEETISPQQIGKYKNDLHRKWLEQWAIETHQLLSLDELWLLREKCIETISGSSQTDVYGAN